MNEREFWIECFLRLLDKPTPHTSTVAAELCAAGADTCAEAYRKRWSTAESEQPMWRVTYLDGIRAILARMETDLQGETIAMRAAHLADACQDTYSKRWPTGGQP